MTNIAPRVSIGLPVYNGENYLEEAIVSILAQSFTDFELIIGDNASSDRSREIVQTYAAQDPRIRSYRNEVNRGAAWNFNRVFELARGQYFKWAAHDDLIRPEFLRECVDVLDADESAVLCFCHADVIDESGTTVATVLPGLATDSTKAHIRYRDLVLHWHTCLDIFGLMRREVLSGTSLIGSYAASDRVLLAELSLRGRFRHVPQILFTSRVHTGQSSQVHLVTGQAKIDLRSYTSWFDTSKAGKVAFPQWKLLSNYARAIRYGALPVSTRFLCLLYLGRWSVNCGRALIADVVYGARTFLASLGDSRQPLVHFRRPREKTQ